MRILVLFLGMFLMCATGFAADIPVPGAVAGQEPASNAWIWIAMILGSGVLGLIWTVFRPAVVAWAAALKIDTLLIQIEGLVSSLAPVYIRKMDEARADGIVTKAEVDNAIEAVMDEVKACAPELFRKLGPIMIEGFIRNILTDKILGSAAAAQVLSSPFSSPSGVSPSPIPQTAPAVQSPPLPDLQPLQPIALRQDVPGLTPGELK